ncbi:MAG TPA: hypothetical protein VG318_03710 [Actinomycetota bacterium]|nr:hypothetical protein [Actinomycetota bacterium]
MATRVFRELLPILARTHPAFHLREEPEPGSWRELISIVTRRHPAFAVDNRSRDPDRAPVSSAR